MFCTKCGTQNPEGAGFCVKCGAKLIADNPVPETAPPTQPNVAGSARPVSAPNTADTSGQQTPPQSSDQTAPPSAQPQKPYTVQQAPVKKKSKAPFIAIGAIVLVIAAVLFAVFNWIGGTDYVATVKAFSPFADDYELPYTYGEVLDKYISNAKWESHETKSGTYVEVSGKGSGTDRELLFEIEVSDIPDNNDQVWISPHSMMVDGEKSSSQDETGAVLLLLFMAYDENCKDFAEITDTFLSEDTSDGVNTIGDTIEVNQTDAYYDDTSGDIEVTVRYIDFVDQLSQGTYPDEDCVYLRVFVSLKNVGTKVASLPLAITIIFDDTYTYGTCGIEGTSYDIQPLSSRQECTLLFEVPKTVMESDKSLVLKLGEDNDKEQSISFIIRDGATS